jgi:predicted nuclease of restriction endonuclease-like (RecB) superfamily
MSEKMISTNSIFEKVSEIINHSRQSVASTINTELVKLYWNIGKIIKTEILQNEKAEYGTQTIESLSNELVAEYGRGYSVRNLFNMIKFYEVFSDEQILHTLCAKLTWSHLRRLIYIDDELKREFYIAMCISERWSFRTMNERINSMLYERTQISKLPEETIKNDLKALTIENKMSADLFFRDPYVLDFLGLKDTFSEKDFENAILLELEKFILEMGRDFAFLGRQVRITVGNKDYYIDLLFYHRKLKRLVLIELKLGEFLPEHKGQVELYLRYLEQNEKNEGEEPPIGIILCAEKDQETVELLELDKSGIHVAQYLTQLPPKHLLENNLRKAIAKAKMAMEKEKEGNQ